MKELAEPFPSIPVPRWTKFDRITGGLRTKEFSIFCGPTGRGKTTFLANLASILAEAEVRLYIASVETGDTDFVKRMMSAVMRKDVNTGDAVPPNALADFHRDHGKIFADENTHLALYDDRVQVEELEKELIYHCETKKCKIAIIDNFNFLMEVVSDRDYNREMDRVSHRLISLSKQLEMHIIMVMHPKKTDGGRVESEFDIKGSSTAVQEAHNVWLFNEPSDFICKKDPTIHQRTHREIKFAKLRRRGVFAGARLIFQNQGGSYVEREMFYDN